MHTTMSADDSRNGAPGMDRPSVLVASQKICVMTSGETIAATDRVEEMTPCNSPCWSSAATRLMRPCKAGKTTAPSGLARCHLNGRCFSRVTVSGSTKKPNNAFDPARTAWRQRSLQECRPRLQRCQGCHPAHRRADLASQAVSARCPSRR